MPYVIAMLSAEDLGEFQKVMARVKAVEANPRAFTAEETIEIFADEMRIHRELIACYEIDPAEQWAISAYDGSITYGEDS